MNEQDRAIVNQGNWFSSRSKEFQHQMKMRVYTLLLMELCELVE